MGPGRLTGMNAGDGWLAERFTINTASMGPGRLTGMNDRSNERHQRLHHPASMGPGRLTGMNVGQEVVFLAGVDNASMGPGRLTGMNASSPKTPKSRSRSLQWGPVD